MSEMTLSQVSGTRPLRILMSNIAAARCGDDLNDILGPSNWTSIDPFSKDELSSDFDIAYCTRDILRGTPGKVLGDAAAAFFARLENSKTLKWVQIFAAGTDRPVYGRLREKGVRISTSSASSPFVALSAFAGLAALIRDFPRFIAAKNKKQWLRWPERAPLDVRGATGVIVGTGPIGREIARLCAALGMTCIGVRRGIGEVDGFVRTVPYEELQSVLPAAAAVVVACPLSDKTRKLFNTAAFASMRPGAYFVNVGRGEVVDEEALIQSLQTGVVRSAYLDVTAVEPLPGTSPLWDLENVIISPHCAAEASTYEREIDRVFLTNLASRLLVENSPEGT